MTYKGKKVEILSKGTEIAIIKSEGCVMAVSVSDIEQDRESPIVKKTAKR